MKRAVCAVALASAAVLPSGVLASAPAPNEPGAEEDIDMSLTEANFALFSFNNDLGIETPACTVDRTTEIATCYGNIDGTPVMYTAPSDDLSDFTLVGNANPAAPPVGEVSSVHTLAGIFRLADDGVQGIFTFCSGTGGYDDFGAGMTVTARDAAGTIIGTGRTESLSASVPTGARPELERAHTLAQTSEGIACTVTFSIEVADVDFYAIEVGDRGEITYSRADLEAAGWWIELSLG